MDADLILKRRIVLAESVFAELVIWHLPRTLPGSSHPYKYRLALVVEGICVLRYDNEAGKGDHIHRGTTELGYRFVDVDTLLSDFRTDTEKWIDEHGKS